jgi:hypothetical protein
MIRSFFNVLAKSIMHRPDLLRVDVERTVNQVARLLNKSDSNPSPVSVRQSPIAGAGRGVFAVRDIQAGTVVTLYPGRTIPALPLYAKPLDGDFPAGTLMPAELDATPATNAYVINCETGGSIDADNERNDEEDVYSGTPRSSSHDPLPFLRRCAHLVNHSGGCKPNVSAVSFQWIDILALLPHNMPRYAVCTRFHTGRIWFVDPLNSQPVLVPETLADNANESMDPRLTGIAYVALNDIAAGDEIMLDYALKRPYPEWARAWYQPALP